MPTHNAVDGPLLNLRTRICSGKRGCGASKLESEFGWQAKKRDPVCLDCRRKANAEYKRAGRAANPESVRRANLWRLYRITPEQYDQMRADQDHRCGGCGIHEDDIDASRVGGRPRADGTKASAFPLQVDHCHRTGAVRGLLCPECNRIIGLAEDRPEVLLRCAEYLRARFT